MIDFHSHILPGMDDGSKSPEESLRMLDMLRSQGVDTVAATPHFYARENPPEEFLRRRADAWQRLRPRLTADSPRVLLGAEVHYFQGISHVDRLHDLCLEGKDVLLLEMPFSPWPSRALAELTDLAQREDITLVLAHIERYLPHQPRDLWPRLHRMGVLFQCNASFFLDWRTRHKAARMLRLDQIDLLGSDCHGDSYRPPRMGEAAERIRRHAGTDALARLEDNARSLLP